MRVECTHEVQSRIEAVAHTELIQEPIQNTYKKKKNSNGKIILEKKSF
jgi:hypothetical protein